MNKFEMPIVSVVLLNGADIICSSGCAGGAGGGNEGKMV